MNGCGSSVIRNGSVHQTSNTFLVQRDRKLIELNDNAYTVVCQRFLPIGTQANDAPIGAITLIYERFQVIGPTEEVITKSVNEIAGKEAQIGTRLALGDDPDGPSPDKPVQLGERMTYVFYCSTNMTNEENSTMDRDCAVGECTATDPTGARKVQLSDQNGCSKHPAIWSNFLMSHTNDENQSRKVFSARLSAWSFPSSAHVLISCRARICDGPCSGGPAICDRANSQSTGLPDTSELINETQAFQGVRLANDAVESSFSMDVTEDGVIGYKVNRPSPTYFPIRPTCHNQESLVEMITAEAINADSGQLRSRSSVGNNRGCVSMPVFLTFVSSLLTVVGVMTSVIAYLAWKLHKRANRTNVVRIEKRPCPL